MRERATRGIGDFFFEELRNAIADIRSKLVDEGWFGRKAGAAGQFDHAPPGWVIDRAPDDALRFVPREAFVSTEAHEAYWASYRREPSFEEQWATRSPDGPDQHCAPGDHEFDR